MLPEGTDPRVGERIQSWLDYYGEAKLPTTTPGKIVHKPVTRANYSCGTPLTTRGSHDPPTLPRPQQP